MNIRQHIFKLEKKNHPSTVEEPMYIPRTLAQHTVAGQIRLLLAFLATIQPDQSIIRHIDDNMFHIEGGGHVIWENTMVIQSFQQIFFYITESKLYCCRMDVSLNADLKSNGNNVLFVCL